MPSVHWLIPLLASMNETRTAFQEAWQIRSADLSFLQFHCFHGRKKRTQLSCCLFFNSDEGITQKKEDTDSDENSTEMKVHFQNMNLIQTVVTETRTVGHYSTSPVNTGLILVYNRTNKEDHHRMISNLSHSHPLHFPTTIIV